MRTFFDITLPFSARLPAWPGEPKPVIEKLLSLSDGGVANVSRVDACVHFGTHMDAPLHFINGGNDIAAMPVDVQIGPALVLHLPDADAITADLLDAQDIPAGTERILFKTRNSDLWNDPDHEFFKDFVAVAPDGAEWLVQNKIRLVGIDYLSIETFHTKEFPAHKILLGAGMAIAEGLDLRAVEPGGYEMACLPMKIAGSDGAPARVVLWRDD